MTGSFSQFFFDFIESLGVIDYQLIIVFTIFATWHFTPREWAKEIPLYGLPQRPLRVGFVELVCVLWIIETMMFLNSPQFQFKQLMIICITRGALFLIDKKNKKIREKDREIQELKRTLEELDPSDQEKIKSVDETHWALLVDVNHYNFMMQRIEDIDEKLIICSAWVNTYVAGKHFQKQLRRALEKGKRVIIVYGWEDYDGKHTGSDAAVEQIEALALEFPKYLSVLKSPSHEKLMVIDEKKAVFGSANWLSNRKYRNKERSIIVADEKLAADEWARIEELLQKINSHH